MVRKWLRNCALLLIIVEGFCKVEINCGVEYKPPYTQIGGGQDVERYEHPWFCDYNVTNSDGTYSHCGGTLISHEYVVTAAHCFEKVTHGNIHKKIIYLRCGAKYNRNLLNPIHVIKHPKWNGSTHDIAVIHIHKIKYSLGIRPACVIRKEELLTDSELTVVGTGETHWSWVVGLPKYPQVANVYLKDIIKCQHNSSETLCAGAFWKTIKSGDEGGPLLVKYNKKYYLVGIISIRSSNILSEVNQNLYPTLFTRIKSQCEFFKHHTKFECYNNPIPVRQHYRNKHECGYSISSVSGSHFHPWYCRIYNERGIDFCGATLISYKYAITSARCTEYIDEVEINLKSVYVKCGSRGQQTYLKNVGLHPGYNTSHARNDVAILQFREELEFDGETFPICSVSKNYDISEDIVAVGMGQNHKESMLEKGNVIEFPVYEVNKTDCIDSKLEGIDSNTICAKAMYNVTWKTDDGGPLVTTIQSGNSIRYCIIGIISQSNQKTKVISFSKVQNVEEFVYMVSGVSSATLNNAQLSYYRISIPLFLSLLFI